MRTNLAGHLACAIAFSAVGATLAGGGGTVGLTNPDPSTGDLFGISVAAVGTDMVIVGAPGEDTKATNDGAAYLFNVNGTLLQTYFPQIFTTNENLGAFVAGVSNGRVLVSAVQLESVTQTLPGAAYLFNLSGGLLDSFSNPNGSIGDMFGAAAAEGPDSIVIGSPGDDTDGADTGRAYVFPIGGEGPSQFIANPTPVTGDGFGAPITAIGTDRVAIGAHGAGEVYVFELPSGDLVQTISPPFPASSIAWVEASNQLLIGSEDASDGKVTAGAAYLFDIDTAGLDLTIPNPFPGFDDAFGIRVAVLGNGTLAVAADLDDLVKAVDAGSVFLTDGAGTPLGALNSPSPSVGDQFGLGMAAIDCNQLVVGTPQGEDFGKAFGPGEAWVFSDLAGGPCSNNYVEVHMRRIDDFDQAKSVFEMEVNVVIPDQVGVVDVDVLTGGEQFIPMQNLGGGHWNGSASYFSLAGLVTSADGFWTIDTSGLKEGGGGFSSSEFPLNASGLVDGNFFATSTVIDPANGSVDVPIDTTFSWTDPTGVKNTADVLAVNSGPESGGAGAQDDSSLPGGTLSVNDTSWDPPQDLLPGANTFEVEYVDFSDGTLAGDLNVIFGNIVWGRSPFAPKGLPDGVPLITLGSSTTVGFGVGTGTIGVNPPIIANAAGIPVHEDTADFDGDGDIDVVVAIPDLDPLNNGTIQVFLNQGTDAFGEWQGFLANEPVPVGREPTWVTTGNFNFDAFPDVCVTNFGDDDVSIFLNDGTGGFGPEVNVFTGDGPSACTTGQFNTDTDFFLDIAVVNEIDESIVILFNDGFGNFTLGGAAASVVPLGLGAVSMTTGDFDGNKCPDAVGSGEAALFNGTVGQVFVLLGQGNGTFGPPILINVGADPRDISVADINGDTLNDIVAANRGDGTISVVVNLGGGVFDTPITLPVTGMPRSIDAVNLDADGDPDIAVVAEGTSTVQVLVNRSGEPLGFGSTPVVLDPAVSFPVGGSPNFVVNADLDVDGISDLCSVIQDSSPNQGSLSALLIDLEPETAVECPADLNGDDFVNIFDFFILLDSWGPCDAPCDADLDGDGFVDVTDLLMLLQSFGPCLVDRCPWDLNGDGEVDFLDLFEVLVNVGDCDDPLDCPWDLDGDGFVGLADVLQVLGNFGPCPE